MRTKAQQSPTARIIIPEKKSRRRNRRRKKCLRCLYRVGLETRSVDSPAAVQQVWRGGKAATTALAALVLHGTTTTFVAYVNIYNRGTATRSVYIALAWIGWFGYHNSHPAPPATRTVLEEFAVGLILFVVITLSCAGCRDVRCQGWEDLRRQTERTEKQRTTRGK